MIITQYQRNDADGGGDDGEEKGKTYEHRRMNDTQHTQF